METLVQDVKYALRMLRKTPAFSAIAIATLALGIGANTAMFSVVNAVLLRPLPYVQPTQLVAVKDDLPGMNLTDVGMSVFELQDLQQRSGVFEEISAIWPIDANVTGAEKPAHVETQAVSANYFTLLGAQAKMGRVFGPQDVQPGFSEAAVISDGLWHSLYGGDPQVLGRSIRLDSDLYRVVGVMPPDFRHPGVTLERSVEVWITAGFSANPFPAPPPRNFRMLPGAIARLKSGLTVTQAEAQLETFAARLREQYATDYPSSARWTLRLVPLKSDVVGQTGTMLVVLLAAVSVVLLIACVNIASLLLARSSARRGEVSIRAALGAGRSRLIRQTLTESVVLALAGGVLAVVLSSTLVRLLLRLVPTSLPRVSEVSVSPGVLLFALGIALLTGVLFGVAPALQLSDPRLAQDLRQGTGTRGGGMGLRQHHFLDALVVSEFALSLVLVVGAGLLLHSFWNLLAVQPGFNPDHVVAARVWLPVPNDPNSDPYRPIPKRAAFNREVLRRLSALPGVQQAALGSNTLPFTGQSSRAPINIEGHPTLAGGAPRPELPVVSPEFFRVLGTPLKHGRFFTDTDNETGALVVLVDENAAQTFWPNEDPLNKRIQFVNSLSGRVPPWFTVVGVVGNTRSNGLDAPYAPHIFFSAFQRPGYALDVYVRTTAKPENLEEAIRREVQSVDPNLPVFGVRTLDSVVADSLAPRRFAMQVLGFFAVTALLLAAIGIYGVMTYSVNQRVREIGIRVALGAQPRDVLRLILGRGLALSAAGIGAGVLIAALATRWLGSLVFGAAPFDPVVFTAGAALLVVVALTACYVPAHRAMRVDPIVALRYE